MMNEDWFGDAVHDLCNPMTDSSSETGETKDKENKMFNVWI